MIATYYAVYEILTFIQEPKPYTEIKRHLGVDNRTLRWYLAKLLYYKAIASTSDSYGDRIYSLTDEGRRRLWQLRLVPLI